MTPQAPALGPPDAVRDQAARLRALVADADADPSRPDPPCAASAQQPLSPDTAAPAIITVASGKGGVGKTNLCVNLSIAFARAGRRTTLLDGDLGLANADVVSGARTVGHIGHVLDGRRALEDVLVEAPGGFRLAPGAAGVASLAELPADAHDRIVRRLSSLERGTDLILIDCGAGIGAGVLAFVRAADIAVVVATPEPTSITDAYALIKCALAQGGGEARGQWSAVPTCVAPALLVNQARGEEEAMDVHRRIAGACRRFLNTPLPLAGWAPLDDCVPLAVRARTPFLLANPRSRVSRAVVAIAEDLGRRACLEPLGQRRRGLLARLLGRASGL